MKEGDFERKKLWNSRIWKNVERKRLWESKIWENNIEREGYWKRGTSTGKDITRGKYWEREYWGLRGEEVEREDIEKEGHWGEDTERRGCWIKDIKRKEEEIEKGKYWVKNTLRGDDIEK